MNNNDNRFSKNDVMGMMNCSMSDNLSFSYQAGGTGGSGSNFTLTGGTTGGSAGMTHAYHGAGGGGGSSAGSFTTGHVIPLTGWQYFHEYYYPYVVKESYPVYIQEKALDKGKQAFEILKTLQDKKLLNIEKVSDFIEAMDTLIKVL